MIQRSDDKKAVDLSIESEIIGGEVDDRDK